MNVGLFGCHRTGKTTLARACAKEIGLSLVETSTTEIFKRNNFNPQWSMSFEKRLDIQNQILDDAVGKWREASGSFITDRTPIDFMMYTIADVGSGLDSHLCVQLEDYITRCFFELNNYFSSLILVQPAIEVVEEEGKASTNPAYMETLNTLARGLAWDERNDVPTYYLKRESVNIEQRVNAIENVVNNLTTSTIEIDTEVIH